MSRRTKFDRAYGDGPFGMQDVPSKIGHQFQARVEAGGPTQFGWPDKRSWKRRRKTRWRPR
jgi:hypothetical protein